VRKTGAVTELNADIADVLEQLQHRIEALPPGLSHRRTFIETYRRTTAAVGTAIAESVPGRSGFEDPDWVTRWDVVFAQFFLDAYDADRAGSEPTRPWRLAFGAAEEHHLLVHLLLGMNAHINYDLPQAMLAVISEQDFDDPALLERRRRDHERIDAILASRVAAEDQALGGPRRLVDRVLTPLNRVASRRMLREARRCVWHNVLTLHQDRLLGAEIYRTRLRELEVLSAAKIADLMAPGQVLLRLAVVGFGVRLPPR
jgi:hypothetical protein